MKYYRRMADQERAVYLYLKSKSKVMSVNSADIAKHLDCSTRTVQRRLKTMIEQGIVARSPNWAGQKRYAWVYHIIEETYEDDVPF